MAYENCTAVDQCGLGPSLLDLCTASTFLLLISSLETSILENNAISGRQDRVEPVDVPDEVYDFVVVGGGAAGSAVASRLSENSGWKVLLMEAGHDESSGIKNCRLRAKMFYENFGPLNGSCLNRPGLLDLCPAPAYLIFMSAIQHAIMKNDVISGIPERVCPIRKPDDVYDFVVVGGGGAGAVVASRLSENRKWKVLVIEAGCNEPVATQVPSFIGLSELISPINWNYKTRNETNACLSNNGSCTWASSKMLGGSTASNAMIYLRGNPTDFNNWAELGNEGWTWDKVKPYFLKAEDNGEIERVGRLHHSTGGPQSVERFPYVPPFWKVALKAASELNYTITEDFNGGQITGFGITQTTSKDGVRRSSAAAYLRPAKNRRNLHVSLHSTVTEVIIKNQTAVGVQYFKNGELKIVKVTKEVILSAGSKRSPHLLLLSGIGPKHHLESMGVRVVNDLPGVGENLHDHVSYMLSFTTNDTNTYDNNWEVAEEYLANQTGPLSSTGLTQVLGLIASNNTNPDYPDTQMNFVGFGAGCAPGDVGASVSAGDRSVSIFVTYLHPESRGRITLASRDPLQYPNIVAEYFSSSSDLDGLVGGVELARKFAYTKTLEARNFTLATKPISACSQYTFPSTDYWKCAIPQGDPRTHHDVGTCKMGPTSDPLAVVDPKLRVHGIKGLRIADASIMPKVTSGNTAAPTMMIGERAADFIKADHCSNKRGSHAQHGHKSDRKIVRDKSVF